MDWYTSTIRPSLSTGSRKMAYLDLEYDMANPADSKQLYILVNQLATGELKENLGSFAEVMAYHDSPDMETNFRVFVLTDPRLYLAVGQETVGIMDPDGKIKLFNYEGNQLNGEDDLPKIRNAIVGGLKSTPSILEPGELASLVGNILASNILGTDGIGIMDLP